MKNKGLIIAVVVIVVVIAGFLFWQPKNSSVKEASEQTAKSSATEQANQQSATNSSGSGSDVANSDVAPSGATSTKDNPDQSQAQYSGEGDIQSPDVAVFEVSFDGTAFSPKTTTIKAGDIVVFKNNSNTDFWPASNNHPTHTLYPEFDPKKAIPAGGKFEFKFIKTGSWGFHNHLAPSITGTIIVK